MKTNLIIYLLLTIIFASCDPEFCRDCGEFSFDLSNWSKMDDTVATELTFVDSSKVEHRFELFAIDYSQPYKECQLASSPEAVSCELTKRIFYYCSSLDLNFTILYYQLEYLTDNPAFNVCLYHLEFRDTNQHLIMPGIDIIHHTELEGTLIPVKEYEVAEIEYFNVSKYDIKRMVTFDSYNTPEPINVDPIYVKQLVFQIPNGLVGITLEDGSRLILKK